ncbi:hypothetical protein ACJIZ3_003675 [Penstemon smallii]|uniref:Uncharacterized protein n=1 Tax=Penstemon smallii TaxID=265156 RepID=A0ABD3U9V1_9LAMI
MSLNSSNSSSSLKFDSNDSAIVSSSSSDLIDITGDHEIEQAIMSIRALKMMGNSRRNARPSGLIPTPRLQPSQNQSDGSNNPSRVTVPIHDRSITAPLTHDRTTSPVRSQRGHRSREIGPSNPETDRSNKRPREESDVIIRRSGKEPVVDVSSDEDIEKIMNSEYPGAGGFSFDSSVLNPRDEAKAWKVYQATIFKSDQSKLGKKKLKENLKKASCELISVNNILYQGYVLAERAFKDIDKSKRKLKEQHDLARTFAAAAKDAEKKKKDAEDEKRIAEMNAEFERLKLESYEKGRAEGISISNQPSREQKLAIAREFYRSPVYDVLSDAKAGDELFAVFDKGWKQCRKLGFLNERFDESALDPMKNDDCEPFPITENTNEGPSLEESEYYPIYLEAMDFGTSEGVVEQPVIVSEQPHIEQHQVLTQEQIDTLINEGVEEGHNTESFDHIDITNIAGDGTQNQD